MDASRAGVRRPFMPKSTKSVLKFLKSVNNLPKFCGIGSMENVKFWKLLFFEPGYFKTQVSVMELGRRLGSGQCSFVKADIRKYRPKSNILPSSKKTWN